MNGMELPLVFFTVLGQAAVGMTLIAAMRRHATDSGGPVFAGRNEWLTALIILGVGMAASLFHLGHPTGSPRTLVHLSTSWLSREVLMLGLFGVLLVIGFLTVPQTSGSSVLITLTALVGLAGLIASGLTYAPPSFPALNNGVPVLLFLLTALIMGPAVCSYFTSEDTQALLTGILGTALILGLVMNLILPSVWMSGGRVMQMTGAAHYGSALYWIRLGGEFGVGLAVIAATRRIPVWLPVVLLAGEILGRILFFSKVVHTATNIGGLY